MGFPLARKLVGGGVLGGSRSKCLPSADLKARCLVCPQRHPLAFMIDKGDCYKENHGASLLAQSQGNKTI
jgi:hypothetical protein